MRYMVGGIVCKSLMGVAWNRFISTSKKGAISQSWDVIGINNLFSDHPGVAISDDDIVGWMSFSMG